MRVPFERTPRSDMQRCSASSTTPTPFGRSVVLTRRATCDVRRSCICSRREKWSTTRASFDNPRSGVGLLVINGVLEGAEARHMEAKLHPAPGRCCVTMTVG